MTYIFTPPALDIDATLGRPVAVNGKIERRIVASLIAHLKANGWEPKGVWDGEEEVPVTTAKEVMELLFNLDDAHVYFSKGGREHYVWLICGNGVDIISDWTFSHDDVDGFSMTLDLFLDQIEKFEGSA